MGLVVVLLGAVFSFGIAAPKADAATVRANVTVKGAGSVTASGYAGCTISNLDDRVVHDCGQHVASNDPSWSGVSTTLTATERSGGQWDFVRWEGCESTSGSTCTVSAGAFSSRNWDVRAIFDDTQAPVVTSDSEAFGDRSATFYWHTNETANHFCKLDSGSFEACGTNSTYPPGKTYTGLSEGNHTFNVQSYDPSGQGSSTLQRTITIVDTAIAGGPAENELRNSRTATFNYSTVAGNAFECSIDFGAFEPCGSGTSGSKTVTVGSDGTHSFRVRARNGGSIDAAPANRSWRIDTAPPDTTLNPLTGPGEGTLVTLTTATFAFTSTEAGTFQCRVNSDAFSACTTPRALTGLTAGPKSFEVRAIDAAGNTDPTPAKRTWTVAVPDADNDGFNQLQDCNDNDAGVNPAKTEVLNNDVDENCDGVKGFDRDGDGVQPPADCDDGNADVNPGRAEVLDNDVDENCDGTKGVSPPPTGGGGGGGGGGGVAGSGAERIVIGMPFAFSRSTKKFTIFTVLQIKAIPIASTLKVTCKAPKKKKCPGGASFTKKNAFGTVKLKKWTKKKLPAGTKLTVTVTKAGNFIGAVKIMTIKKKARPSFADRCIAPGASKAVGC